MARLRTPVEVVSLAIKMRTEGMGVRATGRVLGKLHASIICWQRHLAAKEKTWSPSAPVGSDVTMEGDQVYTRLRRNFPPSRLAGMDNLFCGAHQSLLGGGVSGEKR